jgi:hypothetical protein
MKYLLLILIVIVSILGSSTNEASAQNPTIACSQYPSGISTPSAKDPAFVDQSAYQAEGATWDYRWEADCSQGCSVTADCPQNTANQPAVKVNDSNWCFQFTNGNRCMMLTTTDKSLGQDKNASGGKYGQYGATSQTGSTGSSQSQGSETGTSQSSQPGNMANSEADNTPACKELPEKKGETQKAFFDAKVANNLVRFNAIVKGVPDLCVPADLGATEGQQETATKGLFSGRLLLCSGAAKSEGLPDLVWRIVVGNQLLKPDNKEAPSRDTIESGFKSQVDAARAKVGL